MSKYEGWRPVRFDDVVPGMKKSNWSILIWTFVYLLDLVLIVVIQGIGCTLPGKDLQDVVHQVYYGELENNRTELLPDYELLHGYPVSSIYLLVRDGEGVLKILAFTKNPVLGKYKLDEEVTVPEGQDVAVNIETSYEKATLRIVNGEQIDWENSNTERTMLGFFLSTNDQSKVMGIYLFIAVVMLLLEYGFYSQIRKLRE